MVGGKVAVEAGAVTHGAVRCSAWLGVSGFIGEVWPYSKHSLHTIVEGRPQRSRNLRRGVGEVVDSCAKLTDEFRAARPRNMVKHEIKLPGSVVKVLVTELLNSSSEAIVAIGIGLHWLSFTGDARNRLTRTRSATAEVGAAAADRKSVV